MDWIDQIDENGDVVASRLTYPAPPAKYPMIHLCLRRKTLNDYDRREGWIFSVEFEDCAGAGYPRYTCPTHFLVKSVPLRFDGRHGKDYVGTPDYALADLSQSKQLGGSMLHEMIGLIQKELSERSCIRDPQHWFYTSPDSLNSMRWCLFYAKELLSEMRKSAQSPKSSPSIANRGQ